MLLVEKYGERTTLGAGTAMDGRLARDGESG
jgi:hypothetical protein